MIQKMKIVITGAAQPEYTITADDYDNMVAIECVPMDERGRRVRSSLSYRVDDSTC